MIGMAILGLPVSLEYAIAENLCFFGGLEIFQTCIISSTYPSIYTHSFNQLV